MQSVLGTSPDDYRRLGLTKGLVAPWEDGLRTDPDEESFEWWYLDVALSDRSKLTVEFHTKPPYVPPSAPLTPFVSLTLDRADGTNVSRSLLAPREDFECSREHCDVRIGANMFAGDLHTYDVHVEIDELVADLRLEGEVPPWRPATGHAFYGEKIVAWLPAVPRGSITGALTIGGVQATVNGIGYHDHNWGTAPLRKLIDHWYWGRARMGDYAVVTLNSISHEDYGRQCHPAFMVAKGAQILASGEQDIEFSASDVHPNETTGAQVANSLLYTYRDGEASYTVSFQREKDVFTLDLGKAGAYHRFVGDVTLEHRVGEELLERVSADALWELLDFRPRTRPATASVSAPPRSLVHQA